MAIIEVRRIGSLTPVAEGWRVAFCSYGGPEIKPLAAWAAVDYVDIRFEDDLLVGVMGVCEYDGEMTIAESEAEFWKYLPPGEKGPTEEESNNEAERQQELRQSIRKHMKKNR